MKSLVPILGVAMCAAMCPGELVAARCDIKDGATDWTSGDSYDGGKAPEQDDEVRVLDGRTVYLNASTDSGSMATFSKLKQVSLFGGDLSTCGHLVITVGNGDTKEIVTPFWGAQDGKPSGVVEKLGAGTLQLSNQKIQGSIDYGNNYGKLIVAAGTVCMPTNTPQCTFQCGIVDIAAGSTFVLPWRRAGESGGYYSEFRGLAGAGSIVPGSASAHTIRVTGSYDLDFSGTLDAKVFLMCSGLQRLTGTESTSPIVEVFRGNGNLTNAAILSVAKVGRRNAASSMGKSIFMADVGQGTYRYIGTGEATDKEVQLHTPSGSSTAYPFQLDGGPNGGLSFSGQWHYSTTETARMGHMVLSGENANPCILSNEVASWSKDGHDYTIYLTKRGSGVWRFSDAVKGWRGGLAVEEGTVEYESIAETNVLCSLGYATLLTKPYTSGWDDNLKADYAYALGTCGEGGNTMGTMDYIGTRQAICTTRPFVLKGDGCLKSSVSGAELALRNVSAEGVGGRTLVLDAPAGTTNRLTDVVQGEATLSIVKRGRGEWRLDGEQTASGEVRVEAGRLSVVSTSSPVPYSWFRFTVKATDGTGDFRLQGLALYDEEGRQQNVGLVPAMPSESEFPDNAYGYVEGEYLKLQPGEVCYGDPGYYRFRHEYNQYYTLEKVFWDKLRMQGGVPLHTWGSPTAASKLAITPEDPTSWKRIVMRLTNGAPAVVRYDLVKPQRTHPTQWMMEGSTDGFVWDVLHEGTSADAHYASDTDDGVWYSDGAGWVQSQLRPGKGYVLARSARPAVARALKDASSVRVDRGAELSVEGETLTVNALNVTTNGIGTLKNVAFAAAGVLDVADLPRSMVQTISVDGWSESGFANLNDWAVSSNGRLLTNKRVVAGADSLQIVNDGLMIILR